MASKRLLEQLHETGGCCIYCGHRLTEENATIDHIIPLVKGGVNEKVNTIACCYSCNQKKADKYPSFLIAGMTLRQKKGFENRVNFLYSQELISKAKRDLLLDKSKGLISSHNWDFKLFDLKIKIMAFIRRA